MIHYKQMDKADRDPNQALRAEDECRQLIMQFPNSKFVPEAQQHLREHPGSAGAKLNSRRRFLSPQGQQSGGGQPA